MQYLDARIVRLGPMRVASLVGHGQTPEQDGWGRLLKWAHEQGLLEGPVMPRFFGFNQPASHGEDEPHDYEVWMTIGPEVKADATVKVKNFPGGQYAVARAHGVSHIKEVWRHLEEWARDNHQHRGPYHWLEEHLVFMDVAPEDMVLDLYLPISG
jgi:AraC family transcriptional regulator